MKMKGPPGPIQNFFIVIGMIIALAVIPTIVHFRWYIAFIILLCAILFSPIVSAHHTIAKYLIPHCESEKMVSVARCQTFMGASAGAFLMTQPDRFCEPLNTNIALAEQFITSFHILVAEGADAATLKGRDVMYDVMKRHYTCDGPTFWKEKEVKPKAEKLFNPNLPIADQE